MTHAKTALATILVAASFLGACTEQQPRREDVRPVRTLTVGASADAGVAIYSGEVNARYQHALGFQVAGRIDRRLVEVGDVVSAGTPLMALDSTDSDLSAAASRAQVDSARSQLAQARSDLDRFETLATKGFMGRSELEKGRLALATAVQALKAAEANYRVAANRAGYATLRAGANGVVTAIDAEVGTVVQAGQTVIHVAENGERELSVSVAESRVDELRHARDMTIELWADPQHRYAGRLRELAPDTDAVTRTYAARVSILEPDAALRLGMTARLLVQYGTRGGAHELPITAIYDPDGKPRVWVVDPKTSRVRMREIVLAQVRKDAVLVRAGIVDGDVVVTAGVHLLHPDQRVRIAESQTGAEG
ncbi:MAG: efflux RND transporter periplasmic adaptor subunit [Gammaproteobacteria bacterium]